MFSSMCFVVSGLTFKSLIRWQASFTLACGCPVFPESFFEEFPGCMFLAPSLKISRPCEWVSFWALSAAPLVSCVFLPVPCCCDRGGFVVRGEVREWGGLGYSRCPMGVSLPKHLTPVRRWFALWSRRLISRRLFCFQQVVLERGFSLALGAPAGWIGGTVWPVVESAPCSPRWWASPPPMSRSQGSTPVVP